MVVPTPRALEPRTASPRRGWFARISPFPSRAPAWVFGGAVEPVVFHAGALARDALDPSSAAAPSTVRESIVVVHRARLGVRVVRGAWSRVVALESGARAEAHGRGGEGWASGLASAVALGARDPTHAATGGAPDGLELGANRGPRQGDEGRADGGADGELRGVVGRRGGGRGRDASARSDRGNRNRAKGVPIGRGGGRTRGGDG